MKLIGNKLSKSDWDAFVITNSSPSSFTQSWEWGSFQQGLGHEVKRWNILDDQENLVGAAQGIYRDLPFGKNYLEIPKGPVGKFSIFNFQISNLAKKNTVFVRINPPYQKLPATNYSLQAPQLLLRQHDPDDTALVFLDKSEEELLAGMHEKTRYNIRLAGRKEVVVRDATGDAKSFEKFLKIQEETAKRDRISAWPREKMNKFAEKFLSPSPALEASSPAKFLAAEYRHTLLAGAVIFFFGDSAFYLYAASSDDERPRQAPSLLFWECIRLAKQAGKKYFDVYGIAPPGSGPDHPWAGITRFKTGYIKEGATGKFVSTSGTWDLVVSKTWYNLFKFGTKLKRLSPK